jgi:hypothetical protein
MTDIQDPGQEFRELDEKLRGPGLTPEERARWEELRPAAPEETTGVIWERGPVEQPAEPFPDLVTGSPAELATWQAVPSPAEALPDPAAPPPPLPPPDPAYAAVLAEEPQTAIPEVAAEDVEELLDPGHAVAAVAVIEEDLGDAGEVVSLDALAATPPPPGAASLAPPLPPRGSSPPPIPAGAAVADPAPAPPVPVHDPFAASPSFVAGEHRIVLHTVEGQVLRGSLANADLEDAELPLLQPNGAVARIPGLQIKAVFFMLAPGERAVPASGTRVRVTFTDGRQLSGLSPGYSPESIGFFVLPLDNRTHTARVWVYRSATRQVVVG